MKKAVFIVAVLFVAVISTACINNIAVQELNNAAEASMSKGDFESAIQKLEASLDLDNNMFETYYNLGIAYIESRQFSKAIDALEKSIKLNPKYANNYYSLAYAKESLADEMSDLDDQPDITNVEGIVKAHYSKELSDDDKTIMITHYNSAIENYTKYSNMNIPDAKKEEIFSHIKDIEKVLEKLDY